MAKTPPGQIYLEDLAALSPAARAQILAAMGEAKEEEAIQPTDSVLVVDDKKKPKKVKVSKLAARKEVKGKPAPVTGNSNFLMNVFRGGVRSLADMFYSAFPLFGELRRQSDTSADSNSTERSTTSQRVIDESANTNKLLSSALSEQQLAIDLLGRIDKKLLNILEKQEQGGKPVLPSIPSVTNKGSGKAAELASTATSAATSTAKSAVPGVIAGAAAAAGGAMGLNAMLQARRAGGGDEGGAGIGGGEAGGAGGAGTATVLNMSNQEYYNTMYKSLYEAAVKHGIKNPEAIARLGAAQTCQETGYGKHIPGGINNPGSSNNFFGIKGEGPAGTVDAQTPEVVNGKEVRLTQGFKKYNNISESAEDFIKVLQQNPIYKDVLAAGSTEEAIRAQGKTGYATELDYGENIASIDKQYNKGAVPAGSAPQVNASSINNATSNNATQVNVKPPVSNMPSTRGIGGQDPKAGVMTSNMPSTGRDVDRASKEREETSRKTNNVTPSVVVNNNSAPAAPPHRSMAPPIDPHEPGNVEPDHAPVNYARWFEMEQVWTSSGLQQRA